MGACGSGCFGGFTMQHRTPRQVDPENHMEPAVAKQDPSLQAADTPPADLTIIQEDCGCALLTGVNEPNDQDNGALMLDGDEPDDVELTFEVWSKNKGEPAVPLAEAGNLKAEDFELLTGAALLASPEHGTLALEDLQRAEVKRHRAALLLVHPDKGGSHADCLQEQELHKANRKRLCMDKAASSSSSSSSGSSGSCGRSG